MSIKVSTNDEHAAISMETARDTLLDLCGQTKPLAFQECYPDSVLKKWKKIGANKAQVFFFKNKQRENIVIKIIPIEGNNININIKQKKMQDVLKEVVISRELSNLRLNKKNMTSAFGKVRQVRCLQGFYPEKLIKAQQLIRKTSNSSSRKPQKIFSQEQLYAAVELVYGGEALKGYEDQLDNAKQAYYIFKQIVYAIAVAETEFAFEHRDLHWANILITPVEEDKERLFILDNKPIMVRTGGMEVTIIDFEYSTILFQDVAAKHLKICNLLVDRNSVRMTDKDYFGFLLDILLRDYKYKNTESHIHKRYMKELEDLEKLIPLYDSAKQLVGVFC